MAMQIETFEIEEQDETTVPEEQEAEALGLIDELGLGGQKELTVKKESGETERVPYAQMSVEEVAVYGALFPAKTRVEKYNAGPLPVRVLQVVKHAKDLFDHLEVWHPRVQNPDPILVGHRGQQQYLLARWGSALAPYKALLKQAKDTIRENARVSAEELVSRGKGFLADLDGVVAKKLRGEWVYM